MLAAGRYGALVAWRGREPLGFAGFSESVALYAEGAFATIQEFYVHPDWRSRGIGAALIAAATRLAQERGWTRLELCTPPLPQFQRSLDFYAREGFEVTGGRKMKWVPGS
jgi:GNAT superfamily N-acetyltransferase